MNYSLAELERNIIGCALFNEAAATQALAEMREEDFHVPAARIAFQVISRLAAEDQKIDMVAMRAAMTEQERNDTNDAMVFLDWGQQCVYSYIDTYIGLHKELLLREAYANATRELQTAFHEGADSALLHRQWNEWGDQIARLQETREAVDEATGGELGMRFLDWYHNPPEQELIHFPDVWPEFGERLGGYELGHSIAVVGYSSHGKSVGALQMAISAAMQGWKVHYYSLEMKIENLMMRAVACKEIPFWQIKKRKVPEELHQTMMLRAAAFDKNFTIIKHGVDVESVRARCLREKPQVVFIDHLHLMTYDDRFAIENVARGFHQIAQNQNIAVVLLCQLKKKEGYPQPTPNDIRETQVVEANSDFIFSVWQKTNEFGDRLPEESIIKCLKNRDGESGVKCNVRLDTDAMEFVSRNPAMFQAGVI